MSFCRESNEEAWHEEGESAEQWIQCDAHGHWEFLNINGFPIESGTPGHPGYDFQAMVEDDEPNEGDTTVRDTGINTNIPFGIQTQSSGSTTFQNIILTNTNTSSSATASYPVRCNVCGEDYTNFTHYCRGPD